MQSNFTCIKVLLVKSTNEPAFAQEELETEIAIGTHFKCNPAFTQCNCAARTSPLFLTPLRLDYEPL